MRNFWRQFGEWVTGLRDDPFVRARIKLTLLYAVSIIIVFGTAYLVLNTLWFDKLQVFLTPQFISPGRANAVIPSLAAAINGVTLRVLLILAFIITIINFFVAGKTLAPIRQILRAQKRFIADASHELRTPLAIMKTNAEVTLIDGDKVDPQEAADALHSTVEECDRMSKIIENLLSLSYYDSRVTEIPLGPINLMEVVKHITTKAQSLAVRKSIKLSLTQAEAGMILGNPTALEQMTMNLIKNAVTYTPKDGQVAVSVANRGRAAVELKVADTGIGISAKDLPHVFSPFYKVGMTPSQESSSGLGLTIVKKIVERHQGQIGVQSQLGQGTVFTLTFPRLQTLE